MACIIARQRGPREVTLARYIPLSANRRLIIINHYPVYRLCTLACVSLPLSLLRKSSEAGCLHAPYLSYGRGEGERRAYVLLRTFSRPPFEVHRGIIALTPPSAMVISTGKIDRTNFFSHHLSVHRRASRPLFSLLPPFFAFYALRLRSIVFL